MPRAGQCRILLGRSNVKAPDLKVCMDRSLPSKDGVEHNVNVYYNDEFSGQLPSKDISATLELSAPRLNAQFNLISLVFAAQHQQTCGIVSKTIQWTSAVRSGSIPSHQELGTGQL